MKFTVFMILIFILISSCSTNKQLTSLDVDSDEAIVAGRIKVFYNGDEITEDTIILFNEIMTGKYDYSPDVSGYLVTKLPLGYSFISRIAYRNFFYNFPKKKNPTMFNIVEHDEVNYIGDLTINWVGRNSKISGMFGLIGAVIDEMNNDGGLEVYAEDNFEQFKEYFTQKYNTESEFNNIVLQLPHPDSLSQHKIFVDDSLNPNYLNFNLTKDRSCLGILRSIKKGNIYVERGKKLYVFERKNLISITDKDGIDVTDECLNQSEFEKIKFNSYEVIHL